MRIRSYVFGKIVIGGNPYVSDVIVFPDRVLCPWRRREGHRLQSEDLREVLGLEIQPEILILGTGYFGAMTVPAEVLRELHDRRITAVVARTPAAVEKFNAAAGPGVVAALHLTC